MNRMKDNSIDLVVTSPPYDNLRTYDNDIDQTWGESVWKPIIKELCRVIKEGGAIVWVVNDATINGSETGSSFKQALYFMECGLNLHDTMIYEKAGCSMPSNNRYLAAFEYMFVFSKGKPAVYNLIEDRKNRFTTRWGGGRTVRNKDGSFSPRGEYKAKEYGRRYNIWRYRQGFNQKDDVIKFEHPASFPDDLAHDHIVSWSNEGDIVYDPFLGSGTTAKMAKLNKRKYVGSEINEDYFKIVQKRVGKTQEYLF